MRCQACNREMTPLFISYVCDYCDGLVDDIEYHRGFIVWRERPLPAEEYVFKTSEDADRYRKLRGLPQSPIREVLSEQPFRWRESAGTIEDVMLADRLYLVFPDHRFESQPGRAFLADAKAV